MPHHSHAATHAFMNKQIKTDLRAKVDEAAVQHMDRLATLPADQMLQAIAKAFDEGAGK